MMSPGTCSALGFPSSGKQPQGPWPCPREEAGMPCSGVTVHVTKAVLLPHSRGAGGGMAFGDTVFSVASVNDSSQS